MPGPARGIAILAVALAACVTEPIPQPAKPAPKAEGPRNFVVMVEGRNFVFEERGRPTRFGFSAARNVVASDPEEAAEIAIRAVREDETLNASILNDPDDPPRISVTHHYEVESFDAAPGAELGYIFYRDRETTNAP